MDNKKFIADVEKFSNVSKDKLLKVARQSIDDTVRIAQSPVSKGGNMPVKDGFLRNSIVFGVNGGRIANGANGAILGLSALKLGDVFNVGWTADYAVSRHYAVNVGQGGGLWRDKAAQRWQSIVRSNARRLNGI